MDLELQGKRAIVTGGSRGIGKAIARRLALEGCDVTICARSEGPLAEAADEIARASGRKVVPITCDVMDPHSVRRFVERSAEELGGIEILVNSAARVGGARGDVETVDPAEVIRDFEEKLIGYLRFAQSAVPHMKRAGWGRIVNISGGAGRSPGTQISAGARNAATVNMTRALANSLGASGINVNAVYPGGTVTEATLDRVGEQAAREGTTAELLLNAQAERTLIKHMITAEDVANVVAFLCSPLAIGITGEAIAVNGGSSADVHF
jgi:NAD(P)-dependent dehydrogenase (short-subunit alcohol dehydrogenase family)